MRSVPGKRLTAERSKAHRRAAPTRTRSARGDPMGGGRQGSSQLHSIVHVNEKGGSFGGTEEYVEALTGALAARGVSSHLLCGLVSGGLPHGLASTRIVEGLADRAGQQGTAEQLASLVTEIDPDVVYLHNI